VPEITPPTYLTILATNRGLAYVMRERKMAFPPTRRVRLDVGDQLLLYTSRGVFNNPGRDRGRVVGIAEVASPIVPLGQELLISGRTYTSGCDLRLTGLTTLGEGVELGSMTGELAVFRSNPAAWSRRVARGNLTPGLPQNGA
jgi:hypothetical protein